MPRWPKTFCAEAAALDTVFPDSFTVEGLKLSLTKGLVLCFVEATFCCLPDGFLCPAAAVPPPPPTVITWTGALACFVVGVLLLSWPIRTPTPMARSSVATPVTSVAPVAIRGRRRLGAGAGGGGGGASSAATLAREKRALPRRSPQFTQ